MRLWSLHPRYLDAKGLVALWREALLARKVLQGRTRGYQAHPQLLRFRQADDPLAAIGAYLRAVAEEAEARAYRFDTSKITGSDSHPRLKVSSGQMHYELRHLRAKLKLRAPKDYARLERLRRPRAHPLFRVVRGGVAAWEIMRD